MKTREQIERELSDRFGKDKAFQEILTRRSKELEKRGTTYKAATKRVVKELIDQRMDSEARLNDYLREWNK